MSMKNINKNKTSIKSSDSKHIDYINIYRDV